jgi:hypothetical protein
LLDYNAVVKRSMREHSQAILHTQGFYSASERNLEAVELDAQLSEPLSKRVRTGVASHVADEASMDADVDVDDDQRPSHGTLYYEVVWKNIGKKKTVLVAAGAGGKLNRNDTVVTFHRVIRNNERDGVVVSSSQRGAASMSSPVFVITNVSGDVDSVMDTSFAWKHERQWCFQDGSCDYNKLDRYQVVEALSAVVSAGAHPSNSQSLGCTPSAACRETLLALEAQGLVRHNASDRWFLTKRGWAASTQAVRLHSPSPIYQVREDVPLCDRSAFELMMTLRYEGWAWRLWLPQSKRTLKTLPIPDGYSDGSAMVWFSGVEPRRYYLIALLQAEVRFVV